MVIGMVANSSRWGRAIAARMSVPVVQLTAAVTYKGVARSTPLICWLRSARDIADYRTRAA